MKDKNQLIVIVGPTGSGKTSFAVELAAKSNGQIISADSRQVYRGMDIGTAKDLGAPVRQHLIDIRDPDEELTLAEWQQLAFEKIDQLLAAGITPLLVGGTMLYVDSIVDNYDIPEVEPNDEWREELEAQPVDELFEELVEKDPAAAEFIEPGNKRRIIRALEVIESTGRRFSDIRRKREPRYDSKIIGLFLGWEELERRLAARSEEMIEAGLIKEAESLINKYGADLPLLQTINYKQAVEYLAGDLGKDELAAAMTRANLKYARRQMSWWKRRNDIDWQ